MTADDWRLIRHAAKKGARPFVWHDRHADIEQAAILRAWRTFKEGAPPWAIYKAARWGALDEARQQKQEERRADLHEIPMDIEGGRPRDPDWHTSSGTLFWARPIDAVLMAELRGWPPEPADPIRRRKIREAIKTLPPRSRSVIFLTFWGCKSKADAARVLGLSESRVSKLLRRALLALEPKLKGIA